MGNKVFSLSTGPPQPTSSPPLSRPLHSRQPRRRGHGPVDRRPLRPTLQRRAPLPRRCLAPPLASQNARRKAKNSAPAPAPARSLFLFSEFFRDTSLPFCPTDSPTEPELSRWKQVPRVNAILFTGDRVRGTGDPVIERLSDAAHLAGVLAGKLPGEANAWVVDAACFAGPFAVYRELVPTVDAAGDPKGYDPTGFPAAAGVANILARSIGEV